jgi:hypothetical protein
MQICQPVSASDAPILVGVLLVALLLLPDFAEVAIPGLLSLKRRVELQARRQDQLEERLQMAISQNTSVTNQMFPVLVDPATLRAASRRVDAVEGDEEEEQDVEVGGDAGLEGGGRADDEQALRARLAQELIVRWERLADAAARAEGLDMRFRSATLGSSGPSFSAPASTLDLIAWWRSFRKELEYVQGARNAVAHAQPLTLDTLQQAVELAEKLEDALPPGLSDAASGDARIAAVAFEERVAQWLREQGFEVERTRRGRADFVGRAGDRSVVVETKLARRPVPRSQLVAWVAQLQDAARQLGVDRRILVIAAPGLTASAAKFLREPMPKEVEVYLEDEAGVLTRFS